MLLDFGGCFYPQKVADYLKEYVNAKAIGSDRRIFAISYMAGRQVSCKHSGEGGWESICGPTICVGTLRPTPLGQEFRLKLSAR